MKILNKEFVNLYKNKLDLYIVNTTEGEESHDCIQNKKDDYSIKENLMNTNFEKKSASVKEPTAEYKSIPFKIKNILPSNLDMSERYPRFSKWVSSILQIIKDMKIKDASNNFENIFNKIYPQKDNVPVYNKSGRYWVKLFHMGAYRKIEIDDYMPCGKYEEFLLPKCENLEELWPAIITKALIKLFSYKFKNINYQLEEIGDSAIIYSLTGYIGEKISINQNINNQYENQYEEKEVYEINRIMNHVTSDERYKSGQKFLIAYNSELKFSNNSTLKEGILEGLKFNGTELISKKQVKNLEKQLFKDKDFVIGNIQQRSNLDHKFGGQ